MTAFIDQLARADAFALEQSAALRWAPLATLFLVASAWWFKSVLFLGLGALRDLARRQLLPIAATSGAIAFGLTSLLVMLIKNGVDRSRPAVADPAFEALVTTPGSTSFPSGHAATAFATAVAVGAFCPRLRLPLIGAAALVALSRVYLGVHYWADIAVGSALGSLIGLTVAWLLLRATERVRPPRAAPADQLA